MATTSKNAAAASVYIDVSSKPSTPVARYRRAKAGVASMKTIGKWTVIGCGWRWRKGMRSRTAARNGGR